MSVSMNGSHMDAYDTALMDTFNESSTMEIDDPTTPKHTTVIPLTGASDMSFASKKLFDPLLATPVRTPPSHHLHEGNGDLNRLSIGLSDLLIRENGNNHLTDENDRPKVNGTSPNNNNHQNNLMTSPLTPSAPIMSTVGTNILLNTVTNGSSASPCECDLKVLMMHEMMKDLVNDFDGIIEQERKEKEALFQENADIKTQLDVSKSDLLGSETSFNELYGRYNRMKGAVDICKQSEEELDKNLKQATSQVLSLKESKATLEEELVQVKESLDMIVSSTKKEYEKELAQLKMQVKRYELKNKTLESTLQQKVTENAQLQELMDEMNPMKD